MRPEVLRVDSLRPTPSAVARAVDLLARGGLVGLPTETVYGLGAVADDPDAVARIFEAKGRPSYNPLIVHVATEEAARSLTTSWPESASRLARAAWPGPLTLVLPRDPARVPDVVTGGGATVAVRVPAHPVMLAVLKALGRPIAAPSANRFQALSPTTAAHVVKGLEGRIDLVLDAGPCTYGLESTVVDCTSDRLRVLRPGALPIERLREWAPDVANAMGADEGPDDEPAPGVALPSPGMVRRHYAPRGRLVVVRRDALDEAVATLGPNVAVVTHRSGVRAPSAREIVELEAEAGAYGASLYATLHRMDDAGVAAIVVEAVPDGEAWAAVRDRLARAGS